MNALVQRVTMVFGDQLALQLHIALVADTWPEPEPEFSWIVPNWHPTMYLPRVW